MRVKGSALCAREKWVRAQGEGEWQSLLERLSDSSRSIAQRGLLPSAWYPYDLFVELCEAIDDHHGEGDRALCLELGRYAADVNLPTLYKLFFRFNNPHYIIRKAASAWRVNYDQGELLVHEELPTSVRMEIANVPRPTRAHCLSVFGWTVRACELSGAKVQHEKLKETCRANGEERCSFEIHWR